MNNSKFYKIAVCLFVICLYVDLGFTAEKHALLIGISDYSLSPGFKNLKGPANDIEITRKLLKSRRFDFDHISTLYNETATHSKIENAFKRLASRSKTGKVGVVYIYFSGHGSKTKDLNGDEVKVKDLNGNLIPSYDQTWVTFGSRCDKKTIHSQKFKDIDGYDILDDQIWKWLEDIAAGCDQVVFVSDSCHSGSVSRKAVSEGIRNGPRDRREHPLGRRKYRRNVLKNVIRVGASKDNQTAEEFEFQEAGGSYGVFTWYWIKELGKCSPNDSWSHVFNRVASVVRNESYPRQDPQISGAVAMKVFGAKFLSYAKTISVDEVVEKGSVKQIHLTAGSLTGVTKGSIYTVENKAEAPPPPKIVITETTPTSSTGETKDDVKLYDQLIEIYHQYEFSLTRLLVTAEHEKDRGKVLASIKKIIDGLSAYRITDNPRDCDLMIYLFRPDKSKAPHIPAHEGASRPNDLPPSNPTAPLQIWILARNGFLYQNNLRHLYSKKGLVAFGRNLSRLARVKDIMQVVSSTKTPPLEITVTPIIPAEMKNSADCADCMANKWITSTCPFKNYQLLDPLPISEFLSRKWDLCTMIRFNAKNPTHRPYFFYVIYIGNEAEILPVYPSLEDRSEIAEVAAGSQTARGNATFRLDTKTLENYKLIICDNPINHHLFLQTGITYTSRQKAKRVTDMNPLEKIIFNAVSGKRSYVSYESGSWYAETITIDMR